MVKMKAGDKKKKLILDTAKKLFYEYGFNNTTYDLICSEADIPPGSIAYHFSSKSVLASHVSSDMDSHIITYVKESFPDLDKHWTLTALIIRARWYLYLTEPNINRFVKELLFAGVQSNDFFDSTLKALNVHRTEGGLQIGDKQFRLIAALITGLDQSLLMAVSNNPNEYTPDEIAEFNIIAFFRIIGVGDELAKSASKWSKKYFKNLNLDLNYFKDFAYDEQFLHREK